MKKCLNCGKGFAARTSVHKFCRKECNSAYRRTNLGMCIIDGCNEKAVTVSEKLCHFHRRRREAGLSLTNKRAINPRGEGTLDRRGYVVVRINGQAKFQHRLIVEKTIGKSLPITAHVHRKKWDNRNCNLVVCPSDEYYRLLHRRAAELGIVFV